LAKTAGCSQSSARNQTFVEERNQACKLGSNCSTNLPDPNERLRAPVIRQDRQDDKGMPKAAVEKREPEPNVERLRDLCDKMLADLTRPAELPHGSMGRGNGGPE
jgi:hypothetical protein